MLLSNATVESVSGGVLTIAFAKTGDAKGFVTSGSDNDLSHVLTAMFGAAPQITATVVTGTGPIDNPPGESRAAPRPEQTQAAGRRPRPAARPTGADDVAGPEPSDPAAPDMLTGTDLIERELGGRIIDDLDGQ
jgi:hypothetical protein